MRINPVVHKINFNSNRDNDAIVRGCIKKRILTSLGPDIYYRDFLTISPKNVDDMYKSASVMHSYNLLPPSDKKGYHVDELILRESGIKGLNVKDPNKLYSGEYLVTTEKIPLIKELKKAGIESVVALCGRSEYEENCKNAGLNYIDLKQIGNGTLHPFIIKRGIFEEIARRPEDYADGKDDKVTQDLKEYVRIMKGESEDLPYPIYYGCTQGTNMTYYWTEIYRILKDQDPTKPLDTERAEKLVALGKDAEENYR